MVTDLMVEKETENCEIEEDEPGDEEPWLDEPEDLLISWKETCEDNSAAHLHKGYSLKGWNDFVGIPTMAIPLVMAPLSSALKSDPFVGNYIGYVEVVGFVVTGLAAGLLQYHNYGAKAEKHFNYSARYADLVTDIDHELSKPRKFRQQVDTFTLKTRMLFDSLNRNAPLL